MRPKPSTSPCGGPKTCGWGRVGLLGITLLCAIGGAQSQTPLPKFTDVTEKAGIKFKHNLGDPELNNIVEATGPGGMFFDYDNDGFLDIYLVNGCWHPDVSDNRGRSLKGKLTHALYHNNGNGTFTDVTEKAGVGCKEYGMGVTCADYNNDGFLDIYVLNYGRNVLYQNNGNGTFTDVTDKAGLADPGWSVHAAWLDYNKDGKLDVFVANYLEYDKGEFQKTKAFYAADGFPGPLSYPGVQCHMFRNNGDGTFSDVTEETGFGKCKGRAMSVVAADLNGDGEVDVYVSNDAGPDNLYMGDGKGHFVDQALEAGVAFGEGGQGVSSMGPFVADFDRNGLLDILIPDMGYGSLLSEVAAGRFVDITSQCGLAQICGQYTGWGGLMLDYDNDGYPDVFVANGDPHHLYLEEPVLARNGGQGKFIDVARDSGDFFSKKYVGRGAVYGDYDNDGNLDILMCTIQGPPYLLHNDGASKNNWIKVVPVGKSGLPTIHSVVTIRAGGLTQTQPVIAVNGYLGCNDPRAHFGVGKATEVEWIEVRWPDGSKDRREKATVNKILKLEFGKK